MEILKNIDIMLVEDNEALAEVVKEILSRAGAAVWLFNDPRNALTVFKCDPKHFDVIVTDETMPSLSGFEMAKQMLHIRPDTPIILNTGYNGHLSEKAVLTAGIGAFFEKPVDYKELIRTIRYLFDKANILNKSA